MEYLNKLLKSSEFDDNPCCYIYDLNKLKSKIKILNDKGKQFFYSVKCNPHEKILKYIANNSDIGVEVVSDGEFQKALKYFNSNKIVCGGIGKSDLYLKLIVEKNPYKVVIINEKEIPAEFVDSKATETINKEKLKKALKSGIEIPGCKLVQENRLTIK